MTQTQKDDLIGQEVAYLMAGDKVYKGILAGRLLDFPRVKNEAGLSFEISWPMADRAVNDRVIIHY